ncbi:MAG: CopG family ribbon-helix-helix protein [Thermoanaerobaculia bacterium]
MKRITISVPDELAALIEYEAERRGTSVSDVIRDAVSTALSPPDGRTLGFEAICDDPALPRASSLDEALEEWESDLTRDRR